MEQIFKNKKISFGIIVSIFMVFTMVVFSGCVDRNGGKTSPGLFYSFEEDMQGWKANGTDLDNPPINWSVNRSDEMSTDGDYSVRLYLENFNDAGKIWMERYFDVDPNTLYEVTVSYKFATSDYGEFNLFHVITTVLGGSFSGKNDLNYEGDTGHHSEAKDFVWLDKEYEYLVETDDDGKIYVNIGVWGSWETTRTYYVDEVNISIQKQESIAQLPDLSGVWNLRHYNWEGNLTSEENVTIVQDGHNVEIQFDPGIPAQGIIVKNDIENAYQDTDLIIQGCDTRGIGVNIIYIVNESFMITEMPLCETCNPSVFSR